MFNLGTITFYQLNILFLMTAVMAAILFIAVIASIISNKRLKRENWELRKENKAKQLTLVKHDFSEAQYEKITIEVMKRLLAVMKGENQS